MYWVCVQTCAHMQAYMCARIRDQLSGFSSLLPSGGSQASKLGFQIWQQAPLLNGLSCQPKVWIKRAQLSTQNRLRNKYYQACIFPLEKIIFMLFCIWRLFLCTPFSLPGTWTPESRWQKVVSRPSWQKAGLIRLAKMNRRADFPKLGFCFRWAECKDYS